MKRKIIQKRCLKVFLLLIVGILTVSSNSFAQSGNKIDVKGTVKDVKGESIIGATIVVKGTTIGTVTDIDGTFQIISPANGTLVISYIGFKTQEIPLAGKTSLSITLDEDNALLDEVVVIGYGSVKKNDVTGAVMAIKAEDINRGAITSADQLMQGRMPGLFVMPGDGGPGSGPTVRIRSGASLNANSNPLYVIDGVPVNTADPTPGAANPLATINPNDIETFTVLKDASAAAIYGSRASNGVIIITTKKGGSEGPVKVSYMGTFSVNDPYGRINTMDSDEFYRVITTLSKGLANESDIVADLNKFPMQRTNWQDLVYQTGFGQDHNVTVAGKANVLPYRVSLNYNNETGTIKTAKFERFSGSINLNPKFLNNSLSVDVNLKGTINNNVFADGGVVGASAFFDPTKPPYSPDGSFNGFFNYGNEATGSFNTLAPVNPLSMLYDVDNHSRVKRSIGNIQLDYKMPFLPELRANLNLAYDIATNDEKQNSSRPGSFQAFRDAEFKSVGRYDIRENLRRNQLLDFYLNYNKYFEQIKSNVDVMGGYSYQHFYRRDYSRTYSNTTANIFTLDQTQWSFDNDNQRYERLGRYPVPSENLIVSLFGRLNYTFMERYLLTSTLRYDGASRFPSDNRFGLFPSVALAWRVIDEPFMKEQKVLSDLKFRLGYGTTGQQDFNSDYGYIPTYMIGTNPGSTYLNSFLIRPLAFIPTLRWEETVTKNIAIDYGFLNNRIYGSIDYYQKDTKNLINEVNIAAGTNFANKAFANVGNMKNRGLEIGISAIPIDTKDFSWNLSYNVTFNSSEITNLTAGNNPNYPGQNVGNPGFGTGLYTQKHMVGYAPNTFYLYQQAYDENGNPLQNVFVDRNHDGVITEADRYLTDRNPVPDVFMGFNTTIRYKEFDLGMNLRANFGNYVFNGFAANNSTLFPTYTSEFLNNKYRGAYDTGFTLLNVSEQRLSDLFLEDASFLRMDNITAGYSFKSLLKNKVSGRVSLSVQNVFTLTKYTGLDPEFQNINNPGVDGGMWPRPRMYTLGLNLNF